MNESRPRPVMVYMAVVAVFQAVLGTAAVTDLMPDKVLAWAQLLLVALVAIGGVILQGKVTPVSSPRDAVGNKLVPATGGTRMYTPPPKDGPTSPPSSRR